MDSHINLSKRNKTQSETTDTHRSFLKKALYAAPTLIAPGNLSRPKVANASFISPPSAPNWPDGRTRERR